MMSFIQCQDRDEVEKVLKGRPAFVSPDFRIYDKIEFWDDAASEELDPAKIEAARDIIHHIEMLKEPLHEMNFLGLVKAAKDFERVFKKSLKTLGIKP